MIGFEKQLVGRVCIVAFNLKDLLYLGSMLSLLQFDRPSSELFLTALGPGRIEHLSDF